MACLATGTSTLHLGDVSDTKMSYTTSTFFVVVGVVSGLVAGIVGAVAAGIVVS